MSSASRAPVAVAAGTVSGQSACSVVSSAPAPWLPREGRATGQPALHGLDVDLDDVGELLERQPRARDRGPEVLVLQTLSPSQKWWISRG